MNHTEDADCKNSNIDCRDVSKPISLLDNMLNLKKELYNLNQEIKKEFKNIISCLYKQ